MSTAANPTTFHDADDPGLKTFLGYSLALHGGIALAIIISAVFHLSGNQWGGPGSASNGTKVNLVSSAGIPMPKEQIVTESKTVDPTKGLAKEEPKPPEPKTDAEKIPEFKKEKPLPPSPKSKTFENKAPPPPNAVPYGKGGNPDIPTGYSEQPGATSPGIAMTGQGGSDFATRYGWYVSAVVRKIQANWQQNTVDANIRSAHRAKTTVTFTINRDGTVRNARIQQGSGNVSMDNSGIRALLSSSPMPPLPNDFKGQSVDVTFDFDLSLTK